jgi:hypothetical protein
MAKKDQNSNELRFKNDLNLVIEETDPSNPFGPNYIMFSYAKKAAKKYARMRRHIRISEEDSRQMTQEYLYIFRKYSQWPVLVFFGIWGAQAVARAFKYKMVPRWATTSRFLVPFIMLYRVTDEAHAELVSRVHVPMTEKYLKEAIKNGFLDYKISGTETEYK